MLTWDPTCHRFLTTATSRLQTFQDKFFQRLNELAAEGKADDLRTAVGFWKEGAHKHGGREATVAAAKHGESECLKVLLDEGVKPFIGRNDPEVNPLIHAVEVQSWECVELLIPRALKYNFSTRLLQEGMVQFVIAGDLEMISKCLLSHHIPGACLTLEVAVVSISWRPMTRVFVNLDF